MDREALARFLPTCHLMGHLLKIRHLSQLASEVANPIGYLTEQKTSTFKTAVLSFMMLRLGSIQISMTEIRLKYLDIQVSTNFHCQVKTIINIPIQVLPFPGNIYLNPLLHWTSLLHIVNIEMITRKQPMKQLHILTIIESNQLNQELILGFFLGIITKCYLD